MTSRCEQHHKPPPDAPKRTASEILQAAARTLRMAEMGLEDLVSDDPERRMAGVYNCVVYGVSTIHTLQNLAGVDRGAFNAWYAPIRAEMETDELLRYFYRLRRQILKEGTAGTINSYRVGSFNTGQVWEIPPPGGIRFVMDGRAGLSYWDIELPDGSEQRYYVPPPDFMEASLVLQLENAPKAHRGRPLDPNMTIQALGILYIDYYLKGIVARASVLFG